jgi:hypothetical protein
LYDISLSVNSLNIDKIKILEENKKLREEMKNFTYIMKDNINAELFQIFYVITNFTSSKKNNLFNIKDSYKITERECNFNDIYNKSKILLIIRTIDYLGEGCIIQTKYIKILDKLEKILKNQLEKKFKIKKFYGELTAKQRTELIGNLDPTTDILLLSSSISLGLNLNIFNTLINIEVDLNYSNAIQQEKRIIRMNNTSHKLVLNLVTSSNIEQERLKYILINEAIFQNLINEQSIYDINDIKNILNDKKNHEQIDFLNEDVKFLINKNKFWKQ